VPVLPPSVLSLTLQFLATEFEVACDSPEFLRLLSAGAPRATQLYPIEIRHGLRVEVAGKGHHLLGDDGWEAAGFSTHTALTTLRQRMIERALSALPDHVLIRTAIGYHRGHAFLLVGGHNTGRSTLAVALTLAGFDVSGDDLALFRDGQVIAFPSRFLLWETSWPLLPELPALPGSEVPVGRGRERQMHLDPIDLGLDWVIRPAPIGAVFCLEPNYGGRSMLTPCSTVEAARRIIPHCGAPQSGDRSWTARLWATLDRAHTAVLTLGTPETAVRWIGTALDHLPPREHPAA